MSFYEAGLLIDAYNKDYKDKWEIIRWQSYVTAVSAGAKLKKPEDLIKFEWETTKSTSPKLSPEEIIEAKERMLKKFT